MHISNSAPKVSTLECITMSSIQSGESDSYRAARINSKNCYKQPK